MCGHKSATRAFLSKPFRRNRDIGRLPIFKVNFLIIFNAMKYTTHYIIQRVYNNGSHKYLQ